MANYSKIKRDKLMQSCIATTMEENWILEKWEDIENIVRRVGKLERKIEERFDEDNMLKSKTTWDHCLSL